jgi:hypothetical protein
VAAVVVAEAVMMEESMGLVAVAAAGLQLCMDNT